MNNELTTAQHHAPATIVDRPLSVEEIKARVTFIKEVRQSVMEKDIHYGVIRRKA